MYKRLNFEQYFIDTSNNYGNHGTATLDLQYKSVEYKSKSLFERIFRHNKKHYANYAINYDKERNVIQIHFQKTNGKADWISNFDFFQKYYESFDYNGKEILLRVHNGFAEDYKAVKNEIRSEVFELWQQHPDAEFECIGWSRGSAGAMLCAQDLYYNYEIQSYVYTYGSVKPFKVNIFNKKKVENYLFDCYKSAWNFCNVNDIVTYMPPFWGFLMFNRVSVGLEKFNIFKLFNPNKYHTEYWNKELYKWLQH